MALVEYRLTCPECGRNTWATTIERFVEHAEMTRAWTPTTAPNVWRCQTCWHRGKDVTVDATITTSTIAGES